jgi:hypothetical protein
MATSLSLAPAPNPAKFDAETSRSPTCIRDPGKSLTFVRKYLSREQENDRKWLIQLAPPPGVEPTTYRLGRRLQSRLGIIEQLPLKEIQPLTSGHDSLGDAPSEIPPSATSTRAIASPERGPLANLCLDLMLGTGVRARSRHEFLPASQRRFHAFCP